MKVGKLLLVVILACAGFFFVPSSFQASAQKQDVEQQVARGKRLFASYCASCHGVDARGAGPVASSLKNRPPDLTKIQAKAGKFPAEEIHKKISGEGDLPVHGKKEMPVWGMIFNRSDINSLVKFLESIQKPFDVQPAE